MHNCIHAYMHTYVHTHIHTCIHRYVHACMHACVCLEGGGGPEGAGARVLDRPKHDRTTGRTPDLGSNDWSNNRPTTYMRTYIHACIYMHAYCCEHARFRVYGTVDRLSCAPSCIHGPYAGAHIHAQTALVSMRVCAANEGVCWYPGAACNGACAAHIRAYTAPRWIDG